MKAGAIILMLLPSALHAAVYEVGPGKPLASPDQVPWEKLEAGDEVRIHWRPDPYPSKWVLCRQGTQAKPIIVRGVSGPKGQQPVIDGNKAKTRKELNYWADERSIIKIGGSSRPSDTDPAYITIENLEIRGARKSRHFTDDKGRRTAYTHHAAAIYIEKGHHISIRDCTLMDNGNGLMSSHRASHILVERCHIHSNGNPGSIYHHNVYTESLDITFRDNRLCPLVKDARGNNLKDRSAGLKVMENTIYGGNRQLDLVDAEDSEFLRKHPSYRQTIVQGNLLIERAGDGNNQIIHFGGDSGKNQWYRRELVFSDNTVLTFRTDNTTLFRMAGKAQHALCTGNLFHHSANPVKGMWTLLAGHGRIELVNNQLTGRWRKAIGLNNSITINGNQPFLPGIPYKRKLAQATLPFHLKPCEHHKH